MARSAITCPEGLIIPLFFEKGDKGELEKLLRPDSVLKHLLDNWKEDAVNAKIQDAQNVMKILLAKQQDIKKPIISELNLLRSAFLYKIKSCVSLDDRFMQHIRNLFRKEMNAIENDFLIYTLRYYAILEEHKRLSELKHRIIQQNIVLRSEIERINRRLQEFSCYTEYETWGSVLFNKLDTDDIHYTRCSSAIKESIKSSMFENTAYGGLKICYAYKISNPFLTANFEERVANSTNSLVKSVFVSVSKKHIPAMVLFGFKKHSYIKNDSIPYYRKNFYRLPEFLNYRSKSEVFIQASDGFKNKISASSSCTLERDRKKFESDVNHAIYLVSCKLCIPKGREDPSLYRSGEFSIEEFDCLLPEYVIICCKMREYYEILPNHFNIIPVKIIDYESSDRSSVNICNYETFFAKLDSAYDNSKRQREKLKEQMQLFLKEFLPKFKKKTENLRFHYLEGRKKFFSGLEICIHNLKKELIQTQKFTSELQKICTSRNLAR
jgi:hypothetical protein